MHDSTKIYLVFGLITSIINTSLTTTTYKLINNLMTNNLNNINSIKKWLILH